MTVEQIEWLTASMHRSYLVRLWQSHEKGVWHASAQCVQTGKTELFSDMESLLVFIRTEIGQHPAAGTAPSSDPT